MSILEDAWAQREDGIYPALFGDTGEGIYPLTAELFEQQFDCLEVDARWLSHGVFRCPPSASRNTWVYVSSGMSNPWEAAEPDEYSGLGLELVLETQEDAPWAIPLLQSLLAFNLLLAAGKFGDKPILGHGDRIPQPIAPNIAGFILWAPSHFSEEFDLVSGKVDLIEVIGITAAELQYAKDYGSATLCERLIAGGAFPTTDAGRLSVTLD